MKHLVISFALVISAFSSAVAQSKVITPPRAPSERPEISLQGILQYGEFFGPPGYGENTAKDRREYSFYLQLPAPVTQQNPTLQLGPEFEKPNESFVQLTSTSNAMSARLRRMIGRKVRVTGPIESSTIGHDRTGIVLTVQSVVQVQDFGW